MSPAYGLLKRIWTCKATGELDRSNAARADCNRDICDMTSGTNAIALWSLALPQNEHGIFPTDLYFKNNQQIEIEQPADRQISCW